MTGVPRRGLALAVLCSVVSWTGQGLQPRVRSATATLGARRARSSGSVWMGSRGSRLGKITLVGAGPGDPELLTVAAFRALQNPKCLVIADRLVADEVLQLVKGKLMIARKAPGCADAAQKEIYRWVSEAVHEGIDVVRLKIGDPFVFGRGGEEVLEFRSSLGIEPEVIPGVSAAFASPLLGGVPVTHRGAANQVIMSTGFGRDGSKPALQPYHAEQTAVFLMAVGRLGELCDALVDTAGYPRSCPVAIIERASCPDQRLLLGTIATIAEQAQDHAIKAPSTIVFGEVVRVLHGDVAGLVELEPTASAWGAALASTATQSNGTLVSV